MRGPVGLSGVREAPARTLQAGVLEHPHEPQQYPYVVSVHVWLDAALGRSVPCAGNKLGRLPVEPDDVIETYCVTIYLREMEKILSETDEKNLEKKIKYVWINQMTGETRYIFGDPNNPSPDDKVYGDPIQWPPKGHTGVK